MLRYCANLKPIRYESTSFNRTTADKSHCVIVALRRQDIIANEHQPWMNYENNGNEYLIIGAIDIVRSKYSNIQYQHLIIANVQNFVWSHKNDFQE